MPEDKAQEVIKWKPPNPDVLKFNTDGAYTPGNNHVGWGVIVRDHQGETVAASAGCTEHIFDAFRAELNTVVQEVRMAGQLGAINAVMETNSQLLMLALNNRCVVASSVGLIIDDLKFHSSTIFSCDVVACKRESNQPAHKLATIGWSCALGV